MVSEYGQERRTAIISQSYLRGDIPEGGTDHYRKLAAPLQWFPTSLITLIQSTSARSIHAKLHRVAVRARRSGSDGPTTTGGTAYYELTFQLDPSVAAPKPDSLNARRDGFNSRHNRRAQNISKQQSVEVC